MDLSVILVSYNTAALLPACLDRLANAISSLRAQVFIVDNASRDDSVSLLRERYSGYTIVENKTNVGFGRANNQVLGDVRGKYVLLLNTDAYIEPDAVVRSIAYMDANPRCGVLGARLIGADGHLQPSCRYFPTPWNVFLLHTGFHRFFPKVQMVDDMAWDHASPRQCDWVPGCYYMVRREVVDSVGLFDPRFFLYYEEVDHCLTAKNAGWDVTFFPDVTVLHLGGESAKADKGLTDGRRQISALQAESELLFFCKHHGALGAWLTLLFGWLIVVLEMTKGALRRTRLSTVINAWRHAVLTSSIFRATRGGRRATR